MFTCQFYGGTIAELIAESLNFFFVDRTLRRFHQVDLCGLFEDGLGYLEGLVEISLDKRVG